MRRRLFLGLVWVVILPDLSGQMILPVFPMQDLHMGLYNPALTGGKLNFSLQGLNQDRAARRQDYHKQFAISLSGTLIRNKKNEIAIGMYNSGIYSQLYNYFNAKPDPSHMETRNYRLNVSYSRKLLNGFLSAGINLDRYFHRIHIPVSSGCIGCSPGLNQSWKFFNSGIGVAYNAYRSNFLIGLSYNLIIPTKLMVDNTSFPISREMNLTAGIDIRLHRNLKLRPLLFIGNNYHFMSSLLFNYRERYLFGIGYDIFSNEVGVRCGYQAGRLGLHYHNNISLSSIIGREHSAGITYAFIRADKLPTL